MVVEMITIQLPKMSSAPDFSEEFIRAVVALRREEESYFMPLATEREFGIP